ncbi:phosphatidylinositol 4-phosphate 5-kinase-like protein 1 isoform X1 [Equus przewalskii]|uniref:Phosphatidylinositol 4-phosphate 5-kinase-like protein 1 isoform X1 n=2 Tax=Equus przewalskii TaxID=9798 RepID=A0ABM4MG07_EQUPR
MPRGGRAAGDTARGREAVAGAMPAPSPGPREVLASSPEAGSRAAAAGSSSRGLLWHLQDKRLRLGLFEIDPGHELHQMTCMMQAGLWAATQVSMDHPPTGPPTEEDFSQVLTQVHEVGSPRLLHGRGCVPVLALFPQFPPQAVGAMACLRALQEGCGYPDPLALGPSAHTWAPVDALGAALPPQQGFELGTLAGPAFARLRRSLGLADEDYQAALGPGGPYLQFLSTSKSKASFFLSHDQRFFLKTQRRREVQVLLAHLPRYVQHLQRHPHSLLARLLGVHSLRVAQGKKKYFIIMQSVFFPAGRISERYDIKGCEVSRWVDPAPEGSPIVQVLKDLNFEGKTINLGPQRSWFLRQMELDTAFLRELNMTDYSLLVAFQQLHEDEKGLGSSLIFRTVRSVRGIQSPEESGAQNRRLLPDAPNALHIVDGPEQRYFLGLVDLVTVYGLHKRLEHLCGTLCCLGRTFSPVSPACYARRLCQWAEAHTE